jgi:crossover junction endodeoxyribonuclease RuvC
MTNVIRIIGIDPGLRRTGWGVIETIGNSVRFVASGAVTSDGDDDLARRLVDIHDGIDAVLEEFRPDEAAVEQTFVNKDAGATLKLGQARGVVLLAPARRGLPVAEYAPNAVKKAIVGAGHAEKQQIRLMVKVLMPKATFATDDAADALAIALTHAHHRGSVQARMALAAAEPRNARR